MPKKKTSTSSSSRSRKRTTKKATPKKRSTVSATSKKKVVKKTVTKSTAKKAARKNSTSKKKIAKKKVTVKKTGKKTGNKAVRKTSKKTTGKKPAAKRAVTLTQPLAAVSELVVDRFEHIELKLFEDVSIAHEAVVDDSSTDDKIVEAVKEKITETAVETPKPKVHIAPQETTEVAVKKTKKRPSYHVLDLKARQVGVHDERSHSISLLAQHEDRPEDLLYKLWQDDRLLQATDFFSPNKLFLMHTVLNIATVSWFFYIGYFVYTVCTPVLLGFYAVVSFVARAFVEYMRNLKHLAVLIGRWFSGKISFDRHTFLFPEQATMDVALFDEPFRPAQPRFAFAFNPVAVKSMAVFIILAMVVVAPIKGVTLFDTLQTEKQRVLGASEVAYGSLQEAFEDIQDFSWVQASEHFSDSKEYFSSLHTEFQESHTLIKQVVSLIPSVRKKIDTAEGLVQIGVDVAELGEQLTQLLSLLQDSDETVTLTQKIATTQQAINNIKITQASIEDSLSKVSISVLPEDLQEEVAILQKTLPKLFESVDHIDQVLDFAYIILGGDKQQRYVVMFQNNNEIRASGGFMGSLTTATVYQGKVLSMETPGGGPYDWQGWLTENVVPPRPLQLVDPKWQFQDANWYPHFPATAQKVLWFYHQIKPEVVDGVIAVNADMLPVVLELIGDVELPEYDKYLTPENVLYEIQSAVELEYDLEENRPKAIIGDLLAVVMERLLNLEETELITLLELINNGLAERHLQLYFTDQKLQQEVHDLQWSGEVLQTSGDSVLIVDSNIGGGKTNEFVYRDAVLTSHVYDDGSIVNELVVKRTNDGIPGDPFFGYNYVNYMRVYVPEGAELLAAYGDFEPPREEFYETPSLFSDKDESLEVIEQNERFHESSGVRITDEFGKTVFAGWTQTDIGETSEVVFRYKLPVTVPRISSESSSGFIQQFDKVLTGLGMKNDTDNKYWHSMYWQKQSGQQNSTAQYVLRFPQAWDLEYAAKPGFTEGGSIEYQTPLERDFNTGFLFGENHTGL